MAVSALDRLRVSVADRQRLVTEEIIGVGDGSREYFRLQIPVIVEDSEVIYITGVEQVRDTDYSVDYTTGLVTFASPPAADAVIKAGKYTWTTFSDDELSDALDQNNANVIQAAIQVVQWLLVDTERFMKYFLGQEMIDRSSGVAALKTMIEQFKSSLGSPIGIVRATTTDLEDALEPFIEQTEDYFD